MRCSLIRRSMLGNILLACHPLHENARMAVVDSSDASHSSTSSSVAISIRPVSISCECANVVLNMCYDSTNVKHFLEVSWFLNIGFNNLIAGSYWITSVPHLDELGGYCIITEGTTNRCDMRNKRHTPNSLTNTVVRT